MQALSKMLIVVTFLLFPHKEFTRVFYSISTKGFDIWGAKGYE
jgi:hypothetical protein